MDTDNLKENCIELFLDGYSFTEIANKVGYSRSYITRLIQEDQRVINKKDELTKEKVTKVVKDINNSKVRKKIYIPNVIIDKMDFSDDMNKSDFVNIKYDEKTDSIIIRKHNV